MKIHSSGDPAASASVNGLRPSKTGGGGNRESSADAHDQVQLSGSARLLGEARKPEAPEAAKLAAIRSAIERGEFQVDVGRIAEAMLQDMGL